jgi:hypothetical protein
VDKSKATKGTDETPIFISDAMICAGVGVLDALGETYPSPFLVAEIYKAMVRQNEDEE